MCWWSRRWWLVVGGRSIRVPIEEEAAEDVDGEDAQAGLGLDAHDRLHTLVQDRIAHVAQALCVRRHLRTTTTTPPPTAQHGSVGMSTNRTGASHAKNGTQQQQCVYNIYIYVIYIYYIIL